MIDMWQLFNRDEVLEVLEELRIEREKPELEEEKLFNAHTLQLCIKHDGNENMRGVTNDERSILFAAGGIFEGLCQRIVIVEGGHASPSFAAELNTELEYYCDGPEIMEAIRQFVRIKYMRA